MKTYAPKKVFILENNNYVEISYEELCKRTKLNIEYASKLFLPLHGMLMEVKPEDYRKFYQAERRWKYLMEQSIAKGEISYDMLTTEDFNGEEAVKDDSMSVEEIVERKMMKEKLQKCLQALTPEEWKLIDALYFQGMSERQWSAITGISQRTVNRQKQRILILLKKSLEKS